MRLISSLSWVRKGASQTPQKVCLDKEEMKSLFSELGERKNDDEDDDDGDENKDDDEQKEDNASESSSKNDESIERKYKMDDYDEEDDELRLESINSLACFPTNQDDALLTKKDDGEDSDADDMDIEDSDNLIICGTINEDDSSLDVYGENFIAKNCLFLIILITLKF